MFRFISASRRTFSTAPTTLSSCIHRPLPALKLGPKTIGGLGFGGTLKPGMRGAQIREQFELFLKAGGNFVEMVPGAEQILGEMLKDAIVREAIGREQIITCTTFPRRLDPFLEEVPLDFKASVYFTPDPFRLEIARMGELSPEEAEMDPLLFQLERQLQLNFDISQQTLDVVMVNLDSLQADLIAKEDYTPENLLARLKVLFKALQTKVGEGEILAYGIASENFVVDSSSSTTTSSKDIDLNNVLSVAGTDLKFISAPVNLCESKFVLSSNDNKSPLAVAKERGLCVLSTRWGESLDKDGNGILLETARMDKSGSELSRELRTAFDHACQWERSAIDLYKKVKLQRSDFDFEWASWGHRLSEYPEYLKDLPLWNRALSYRILPYLHVALNILLADPKLTEWVLGYKETLTKLFGVYTQCVTFGQQDTTQQLHSRGGPGSVLQNQAMAVALNSGVDCVLSTDFTPSSIVAGLHIEPNQVTSILRDCARFGPAR